MVTLVAGGADAAWGALASLATQLLGTFVLRPYVVGFLAFFLVAGFRDLGRARTGALLLWGGVVALAAELCSTRIGFPFGLYDYTGDTRGAELFVSNVPFFSPLSFPFLAYAAFCLARRTFGPRWATTRGGRARLVVVAGALMMLLDVVIDPAAVRGGRWFLGHIFQYPEGGLYFGVPLSNFMGWLLVGWVTVGGYVWGEHRVRPSRMLAIDRGSPGPGIVLYYLVLAVNLSVTFWIGEELLGAAGILVHLGLFLLLYGVNKVTVGPWSAESLSAPAMTGGQPRP
ncbi:MAG TPA: carotenoid biosynthesis protein [Methylomirabilota bacterium]|nr:carotenoid biosynthesis protein [Methylomirabilota bacterium]